MRREGGKIKESPHTLPSNIIRLSLMALLYFLPCACLILSEFFFSLHPRLIAWPCGCFSHLCMCVCAEMCTCIQCTSCLPLALGLAPPFGLPAINPFIPSKTSKLPSSGAREGAALCLMSLLFCCSDLPLPKPRSSAVTHGSCDNGDAL